MTADRSRQSERLLHEAVQLPPRERSAFVSNIGDPEVRAEVASLLAAQGERGAVGEAAQVVLDEPLPGRMLAHFQIIEPIGRGAMGEVYLATDVKLRRRVALKLLPPVFQQDPEHVRRFEREARAAAALNHPNIMTVHEVGECQGRLFIAAEYVEGETLADLLRRGPLPAQEALRVGTQIAEALQAAHEKGVIHRDLKPANIKIKPDGAVKVLDFGLAKLTEELSPGASSEDSPTVTQPATSPGVILGTPAYMSPEQARGIAVDKQADIWAFGAVLYEMLTGNRAFGRKTKTDTLAAVVKEEPDLTVLPARLRTLVGRCLRKDPRKRWHDIGDVRIAMEEDIPNEAALEPGARPVSWVPWLVAAAACIAALTVAIVFLRQPKPAPQPLVRLNVDLGPSASLSTDRGRQVIAISPDGTRIAFACGTPDGEPRICTRRLDQTQSVELAGTEGAQTIFFSPDAQWIGFTARGKLKKVSVSGGAPIILCDAPFNRGASWGEDGFIVASLDADRPLERIPEKGGAPQPVTRFNPGEQRHRWPQVLPGANAVLFTATTGPGQYENASLEVVSLKTGERKTLLQGGYYGRYLPSGHLIYMHQGTLFAARMDAGRLALTGPPAPVLEDVASRPGDGGADFDFSHSGVFVYQSNRFSGHTTIQWLDKSGKLEPLLRKPGAYDWIRLSPDGKRLAIIENGADRDISVYDLERSTMSRVTFGGINDGAVWSPDGKHLAYGFSGRENVTRWLRADGSGEPQLFGKDFGWIQSISPDGKRLAVTRTGADTNDDIWIVPLEGFDSDHPKAGEPKPFVRTPASEAFPAFSPDGHWLAYASDESGSNQVYVRPLQSGANGGGGKWQISTEGGTNPIWSRNGRELFYASTGRRIMVTSYTATDGAFIAGKPVPWCDLQAVSLLNSSTASSMLDLAPDGARFVVLVPASTEPQKATTHVNVLLSFWDELRRRTRESTN
jgi:serine/threonine protein kinase/Tol biopolymer transport system component